MPRLPLPDRGSPMDVTYIYQMANAINDLASTISNATYNYTTVQARGVSDQNIKTSDVRIVAGFKDNVINNENVLAGTTRAFSYNYPSDFKYAPIATATPINTGQTPVGNDVTIVLTSVTTSRIDGFVRFMSTGTMSLSINFLVVGIPT